MIVNSPSWLPCSSSSASRSAASPGAQSPEPVNTLTPTEKSAGWTLLFDGKSTSAWRGYKKPDMDGLRWKRDGSLALPAGDGSDTLGQRDIISAQPFDVFDLACEWRVAPGRNSGVKCFVTENTDSAFGHQYQIIDGAHEDAALREVRRQTASFYDVLAAPAATPFPASRSSTRAVVVTGNHVEHWLNGAKVLEYPLDTDILRAAIEDSKFKDAPRLRQAHSRAPAVAGPRRRRMFAEHQGPAALRPRPGSRPQAPGYGLQAQAVWASGHTCRQAVARSLHPVLPCIFRSAPT